jgi:pyruvate carboxylase
MIRAMPNQNDITKAIEDKDLDTLDSYLSIYVDMQEQIDKVPPRNRTTAQKMVAKRNSYTMDRIMHAMQVIKREFKLKVKAEDIKTRVDPIAYGMYLGQMKQYAAQQDRESARKPKVKRPQTQKEIDYEVQQALAEVHDKRIKELAIEHNSTNVTYLEKLYQDEKFLDNNVWAKHGAPIPDAFNVIAATPMIVGPMNEDAPPPSEDEVLVQSTIGTGVNAALEMADWEQKLMEEDEATYKAAPRILVPEK